MVTVPDFASRPSPPAPETPRPRASLAGPQANGRARGRVGIGIVTYNRCDIVLGTIARLRQTTRWPGVDWVVADDGSSDDTVRVLRRHGVPVVTGANMGIAWNKNRALYMLCQMLGCETIILLEDDVRPIGSGWMTPWVEAASRWGHVNWAGPWLRESFVSGTGTPADPIMCKVTSAQVAAFSRDALSWGGYFDPRFRGFGHEHVEHSRRLIRIGYGGTDHVVDGAEQVLYAMIEGAFEMVDAISHLDAAQVEQNLQLARRAMGERVYRAPWIDEAGMNQFRAEIEQALAIGRSAFALNGDLL